MNPFDIEKKRQNLLTNLPNLHGKTKLFLLFDFFDSLIKTSRDLLTESYALEFIEEYLNTLKTYSPYCVSVEKSETLIEQINTIALIPSLNRFKDQLYFEKNRIEIPLDILRNVLNGENNRIASNKLYIPLLEENNLDTNALYGFLESVKIIINKSKDVDRLYVFPSIGSINKKIENQIKDSMIYSLQHWNDYENKFSKYHEVFIYFENYSANYIGNSLGIALTIGFIEQFSRLYNLPYLVNIKSNVASTGSISAQGKILPVGNDKISKKIEAVFYSPIESFILHLDDELAAKKKLAKLKNLYPNRNLKIIAVSELQDILDRRNLVNIEKQNTAVRIIKSSIKNWQVSLLLVVLYLIVSLILLRDLDTNPQILESSGNTLYVKNASGKLLWTKSISYDAKLDYHDNYLKSIQQLVDIDNDGNNEVIISSETYKSLKNQNDYGRIVCLSSSGQELWKYNFCDSISSFGEILEPSYSTHLVDVVEESGKKILLAFASNRPSFSSAMFKLDIKTGERIGNVLWHAGFIRDAVVSDFDKDGKLEVAFVAINNAFEKAALGVIDLYNVSGQCPSTKHYTFVNIPNAELKAYILFPKTDFIKYFKYRTPGIDFGVMINDISNSRIIFSIDEGINPRASLSYNVKYDWKNISIIVGNTFRVVRDTLVAHNILNPPFTDTKEYVNLLKDQILYWENNSFVTR